MYLCWPRNTKINEIVQPHVEGETVKNIVIHFFANLSECLLNDCNIQYNNQTLFQLNNEDTPRYDSSVGEAYQKAFQALNLLLPGTAFTYYGDEIAMSNGVVVGAANKDPMFNAGKVN